LEKREKSPVVPKEKNYKFRRNNFNSDSA